MAMGGKAGEQFTEINVTPLTDVFLVLLVIMILVAPLVNMSVLKVDPPGSSSNPDQKQDNKPTIKVDVGKDGVIKVNGNAVAVPDTQHVADAMAAVSKGDLEMPVVLTSDADSLQKYVVAVMDAAAGLGLKKLSVAPLRK